MGTDIENLARKITFTLFMAMSLASAGIILAATVNPLIGTDLGGSSAWAGIPSAVFLLGTAFSAVGWGFAMDRIGRRGGLTLGMLSGVIGTSVAGKAVIDQSLMLFLVGIALTGVAQGALQLSRFAAAEVHPPNSRGRAISYVVLGGTFGAVLGPWLVGPLGSIAAQAGYPELSGAFFGALILYALVALIVFTWLRPDPRDLGREVARRYPEAGPAQGPSRSIGEILRQPAPLVAVTTMVVGQMVMVMLMVITAVHMKGHQHALTEISLVISSHTFGMYAFSIVSGQLADRWGRLPVILAGLGTTMLACLLAPLSPDVVPLAVSLFFLGLGWNFCFVGGSSLLSDQLAPAERARTQGFNDLLIGLASAFGSFSSGLIFAATGYALTGLIGAVACLIPLGLALWWRAGQRRVAVPS